MNVKPQNTHVHHYTYKHTQTMTSHVHTLHLILISHWPTNCLTIFVVTVWPMRPVRCYAHTYTQGSFLHPLGKPLKHLLTTESKWLLIWQKLKGLPLFVLCTQCYGMWCLQSNTAKFTGIGLFLFHHFIFPMHTSVWVVSVITEVGERLSQKKKKKTI